jgi:hypothetical protein
MKMATTSMTGVDADQGNDVEYNGLQAALSIEVQSVKFTADEKTCKKEPRREGPRYRSRHLLVRTLLAHSFPLLNDAHNIIHRPQRIGHACRHRRWY